jgi:hypothetical protein
MYMVLYKTLPTHLYTVTLYLVALYKALLKALLKALYQLLSVTDWLWVSHMY